LGICCVDVCLSPYMSHYMVTEHVTMHGHCTFHITESLSLVHTKESLWSLITKMVEGHFCYKLKWYVNFSPFIVTLCITYPHHYCYIVLHCCRSSLNKLCNSLRINKIVLLRRLCKCVGEIVCVWCSVHCSILTCT